MEKIYLHLGCGDIAHPKFVNIDIRPAPHVHYVREINDLTIFDDESIDLIYASHCLEHFSFRMIPSVLKEWHRVLKRNGILRISVPNFDTLVDVYLSKGRDVDLILSRLMGGQDYDFNYHKTIFTRISLEHLLVKVTKFNYVREWKPGLDDLSSFDDCSKSWVSLNLEAIK